MTSTEQILNHHLTAFGEQNLEGVLSDYAEDAVVITNNGTFRGHGEIGKLLEGLLQEFGQEGSTFTLDQQTVEGDVAYFTWHGQTPANTYRFCTDTLFVKDGQIAAQTFTGDIEPR